MHRKPGATGQPTNTAGMYWHVQYRKREESSKVRPYKYYYISELMPLIFVKVYTLLLGNLLINNDRHCGTRPWGIGVGSALKRE